MLESILVQRKVKVQTKVTVKTLVAVGLIVLAVALPQIVHVAAGASGGMMFMPMYLPVLIAGCLLGSWWGLAVGIASPVVSFFLTSMWSSPMPALARLPFMIVELAVFAVIAGLFSKKIVKNKWMAFPAVLLAQVSGRAVFLALAFIFESVSGLAGSLVWSQIQTGLIGLVLQAIIVPFIIIALSNLIKKEEVNE